jgi:predicted nucleic acid-binding protein
MSSSQFQCHRDVINDTKVRLREFTQVAWIMRSINDCLIAAVAIRYDVRIIHQDNDFDVIAAMTTLVATSG